MSTDEMNGTKDWPQDREWDGDWEELLDYRVTISRSEGLAEQLFMSKQEAYNAGLAIGAHLASERSQLNE